MQTKSALFQSIQSGEHYVDIKINIAGTDYDGTKIKALSFAGRLFDKYISIGNCNIRSANASILASGIVDGSAMAVYARVCNATQQSEWLQIGSYFVYEHEQTNDITSLVAYDVLVNTERTYVRTPWDSPTMQTVAADIASKIGTTLTQRATNMIPADTVLQNTAMSMRDHLCDIATAACANWVTTYDGKLDLVSAAIPTQGTNYIVNNGDVVQFNAEEVYTAWLGVELSTGTTLYKSTQYTEGARIMRCYDVSGDQTVCDRIMTQLTGTAFFRPYSATVNIDIAAELGDIVLICGTRTLLAQIDMTAAGGRIQGTIAAPGEGSQQMSYEERFYRELSQRTQEISLVVSTKVGNDEIISKINQSPEAIQMNAQRINFSAASIVIDGTNSEDSRLTLRYKPAPSSIYDWMVNVAPDRMELENYIENLDWTAKTVLSAGSFEASMILDDDSTEIHFRTSGDVYSSAVTRTSGATIEEQEVEVKAGIVFVNLFLKKTTATSSGSDIFQGSINAQFLPKHEITSASYYQYHAIIGRITDTGVIYVRNASASSVTLSNGFHLSFSFPIDSYKPYEEV